MIHPNFEKEYGKDQVSIWHYVWQFVLIIAIVILSFYGLAYLPALNEWMDKTFDKSDQQRTGVIMLGIGSFAFVVLFLTGSLKR